MCCIPLGRSEGAITIWRRLFLKCPPKRSIQHTTNGKCVDLASIYGLGLSSSQMVPAQALFGRSLMLISCTRALHSKDMDWKKEKHLMRCNNALEAVREKTTQSLDSVIGLSLLSMMYRHRWAGLWLT